MRNIQRRVFTQAHPIPVAKIIYAPETNCSEIKRR